MLAPGPRDPYLFCNTSGAEWYATCFMYFRANGAPSQLRSARVSDCCTRIPFYRMQIIWIPTLESGESVLDVCKHRRTWYPGRVDTFIRRPESGADCWKDFTVRLKWRYLVHDFANVETVRIYIYIVINSRTKFKADRERSILSPCKWLQQF